MYSLLAPVFFAFFLQALQLVVLAYVPRYRDDLGVIVVLFQPGYDNRCVQSA